MACNCNFFENKKHSQDIEALKERILNLEQLLIIDEIESNKPVTSSKSMKDDSNDN